MKSSGRERLLPGDFTFKETLLTQVKNRVILQIVKESQRRKMSFNINREIVIKEVIVWQD